MFVSTLELLTQASARSQGVSLAGLSEEVPGKGNCPFTRDKCPLKVNGESMEGKICLLNTSCLPALNVLVPTVCSARRGRNKAPVLFPHHGKGIQEMPRRQKKDCTTSEQNTHPSKQELP